MGVTADSFVLLDGPQLKQLAQMVHDQEIIHIKNMKQPDIHTVKQLVEDSLAARDGILDALDHAQRVYDEYLAKADADALKKKIAEDHFHYVKNSANNALQNIRNFSLRRDYGIKIRAHSDEIIGQMVSANLNAGDLESLAKACSGYRNAALDFARSKQTPTSRAFSKMLKESGLRFDQLVNKYQLKLNETGFPAPENPNVMVGKGSFTGEFEELLPFQKIAVYEEVIAASGRANPFITKLSIGLGAAGIALMLVGVGLLVWDVYESAHPVETAVRGAVDTALGVLGALGGELAATAVAPAIAGALTGAEATPMFLLLAGVAGGLAGAFIVGALVALVMGAILGSGGRKVVPLTQGMKASVLPLPDGRAMANQLLAGVGQPSG